MTYYITPFGDGSLPGSGGNVNGVVHNHFGPMTEKGPEGIYNTDGMMEEISLEFTSTELNASSVYGRWLIPLTLPTGAVIKDITVDVKSAFTLGGTSPTIQVGTQNSVGTNGITISQAQAQAVGVYVESSFSGTWASPLTAPATIDIQLGGTSPTATGGRVKVYIRYIYLNV